MTTYLLRVDTASELWRQVVTICDAVAPNTYLCAYNDYQENNYAMGDQVVAGDIYDEEEDDSFFQDVDVLQSFGIVS